MNGEKIKSAITEIALKEEPFKGKMISPTVINFFYGKNGTGKTSVSKAICSGTGLTWKASEPESEYLRLVFNRDFVQHNLLLHSDMPGVFTISEQDVATVEEIKNKTSEKKQFDEAASEAKEKLTVKTGEKFVKKTILTEACWNISKTARTLFKQEMRGYLGDSKKFTEYVLSGVSVAGKSVGPVDHGYEALQVMHNAAYNDEAKAYALIKEVNADTLPACDLLSQVITNSGDSPFATFIKALGATSWVQQGHEKYHTGDRNLCPYCQQKLPADFEDEFAACFDEVYKKNVEAINRFLTLYREKGLEVYRIAAANLETEYKTCELDTYRSKLEEFKQLMQDNLDLIRDKEKDPAKTVTLKDTSVVLNELNDIAKLINAKIKENNDAVATQGKMQEECQVKVWEQLVFDLQESISNYKTEISLIEAEEKALKETQKDALEKASKLADEIDKLNETNSNTQDAIKSINSRLADAGFQGFMLREKEKTLNRYEVVRSDGRPAQNLSEGEINFIAFLYFYHLVYGSDKAESVSQKKIVVIDDPVSSMDSDVLFIVGALVRDLIEICRNNVIPGNADKEDFIKQIFVLTHNAYFHQEVSYNEEPNWDYVSFFILKKENNVSSVELSTDYMKGAASVQINKSPVKNTYAALWDEYDEVSSPIALLNVMRRILEYYFLQISRCDSKDLNEVILVKHKDDLIDIREDGSEDRRRYNQAKAMLSYLAVNRIGITDGLHFIDDFKDIELCKKTFEDIFYFMDQHQHFEKMTAWKKRGA